MPLRPDCTEERVLRSGGEEDHDARADDDASGVGQRFLFGRSHQPRQALRQDIGAVKAGELEEPQSRQQQKNAGKPQRRERINGGLERAGEIELRAEEPR